MVALTSLFTILTTLAAASTYVAATASAEDISQLIARQSTLDPSMIPAQCRSQCTPLLDALNANCTDLDCICGSSMANDMIDCLKCGEAVVGADTAQTYYDTYSSTCKSAGKTVPNFTASGSSGSSGSSGTSSSSASPSPSGTSGASATSGLSSSSGSSGGSNGASHTQLAGAGLACVVGVGLFLVA